MKSDIFANNFMSDHLMMVQRSHCDQISLQSEASSSSFEIPMKHSQHEMVLNPTGLLDQILVQCPNTKYCSQILPKCDLTSHILEWCHGILCQCPNRLGGCNFFGPKWELITHKSECQFKSNLEAKKYDENSISKSFELVNYNIHDNFHNPKVYANYLKGNKCTAEINEGQVTVIEIDHDVLQDIGVTIVGGIDTPLQNIFVQDVIKFSAAHRDGRLRSGDQILEVNQLDLSLMTHNQAVDAIHSFKQNSCSITLSILRENTKHNTRIITAHLRKENNNILGLKMGEIKNKSGVYILEIIKNSEAELNGRLKKNDLLLKVNDIDLKEFNHEKVSQTINNLIGQIKIVVLRNENIDKDARISCPIINHKYHSNSIYYTLDNNFISGHSKVIQEKFVSITKKRGQYLGLTIAGGLNFNDTDTPIYITNIAETSVLKNSQRIEKGDVLLSVNNVDLLGIQHGEAVAALKFVCEQCEKVDIRILKCSELYPITDSVDFTPTWSFWLNLPNYYQFPRVVIVFKDQSNSSIGFSIVGGFEYSLLPTQQASPGKGPIGIISKSKFLDNFNKSVIIKSIVSHSPADKCGQIKCGDILISVNDISVSNISHSEIVSLLRKSEKQVKLKILSFPGSII